MKTMRTALLVLALILAGKTLETRAETPLQFKDVFVGGQDGYPAYRIPSLIITQKGTLLAFAEARANKGDHARNKIVLKRSLDKGATWRQLQLICDAGSGCLNNPEVVVEKASGRIILMFQKYPESFDESSVVAGLEGDRICRTLVTHSDDDGLTWSAADEITASVKPPVGATSNASGPGIGIQLASGSCKGRLVFPFNQGPPGHWKVYAVYSDDRGATWKYGEVAPEDSNSGANEVQMVELTDGTVMLNARNQMGSHQRRIALSKDGGQTWSRLSDEPTLIEPRCQGSILRHPVNHRRADDVLLFSNPVSVSARTNGIIRLSKDDGKTWAASRTITEGEFAYSCLVSLDHQNVGCLFERDNYDKISFTRFSLKWILAKAAANAK